MICIKRNANNPNSQVFTWLTKSLYPTSAVASSEQNIGPDRGNWFFIFDIDSDPFDSSTFKKCSSWRLRREHSIKPSISELLQENILQVKFFGFNRMSEEQLIQQSSYKTDLIIFLRNNACSMKKITLCDVFHTMRVLNIMSTVSKYLEYHGRCSVLWGISWVSWGISWCTWGILWV